MAGQYTKEKIENWVSDSCSSDAMGGFSSGTREYAADLLVKFLVAACDARGVEPEDIEEPDCKQALLGTLAKLQLPSTVKAEVPALCGTFLTQLEAEGRLGGGKLLGAYVRALKDAFADATSGKPKPVVRPGSRIGRNDPCPCGSGKKYKKCCMRESKRSAAVAWRRGLHHAASATSRSPRHHAGGVLLPEWLRCGHGASNSPCLRATTARLRDRAD